ncbi:unnamed protein product [Owenia fusiformis]|uniref:Uncharacterized protein n=1 Tax=Owenia fusiformis TaxID=6347 RepID=A0A8J1YDB0_OWEFU|nr:unnamed protein product [Owenia fusiformis]
MDEEYLSDDDFLFYSVLYSTITVIFAMAILTKFLMNEIRFGFRSCLSLVVLFIGEPLCHFLVKGPAGVAIFGLGCLFVHSILPASHLPVGSKSVLITGCDSGFGHALALTLDSIGIKVFAGCLYKDGPGAIELTNKSSERLTILQLDVTSSTDIQKAYDLIKVDVGEKGLWGLVNNAGVAYIADIELTPNCIVDKVLNTNLKGPIFVTKKFLPLIRQAQGRIVNVSSLAGKVPTELYGAYSVAKHGIEAFSDVLRMEMKKWNVKVSVIQPSGFLTAALSDPLLKAHEEEIWSNLDTTTRDTYGRDYLENTREQMSKYTKNNKVFAQDITPVVRAMRSGLLSKRPRAKYPCVAIAVAFRQMVFNTPTKETYSDFLEPGNSRKEGEKSSHPVDESLVPNIVHYIWVDLNGYYKFNFLHAVSFISVHKNWKPDEILVHVNKNNRPHGEWWDYVMSNVTTKIRFISYNMAQIDIFGEKPRYPEHISDILRLRILKEYGGTYIDSDVIALRSLAHLRRYNHTQGIGIASNGLSNGVIIAKKTSKFLDLWIEEYKKYGKEEVGSIWSHYSIFKPRRLLADYPDLVRIERNTLVRPVAADYELFTTRKYVWDHSYSIHVWRRKTYIPYKPDDINFISNQSLLRDVMEYVVFDKIPPYATSKPF